MDVGLSDLLTCPRCGPLYGLVLLPEEVRERRVVAGVLGCANCRERYVVEGGVADLRAGSAGPSGSVGPAGAGPAAAGAEGVEGEEAEGAVRLAALLGLTEAGGTVLVAGPGAAWAGGLLEVVDGVKVVGVGMPEPGGVPVGVSWLRVGERLPLRGGILRGVALTGEWAVLVEEGARLLGPAGRLVLEPAPEGARSRVEAAGLGVLLEEAGVLVAGRGR